MILIYIIIIKSNFTLYLHSITISSTFHFSAINSHIVIGLVHVIYHPVLVNPNFKLENFEVPYILNVLNIILIM